MSRHKKLQITGSQEWNFPMIEETTNIIENIAKKKYNLDFYKNQLEIISAEQMIDSYTSGAMPVYYNHWSFGEEFIKTMHDYKRGATGLAYEVVINTNPAIAYLMEHNTMLCQALVIAHASIGHNTFFKNNYLMKQWTDPTSIVDYLLFAKNYISRCEEKYGSDSVESVLDCAHSLKWYGVDRYKRVQKKTKVQKEQELRDRENYRQSKVNELWTTIPVKEQESKEENWMEKYTVLPKEPEENILYFLEKHAPRLEGWEREILRIIRKISQYFYPNIQTNLCNEGAATFWHYKIIHDLNDMGIITPGGMLEFYSLHTAVVRQSDHNPFNVYALGHAMYKDIERVSMNPTEEDIAWFGNQEWVGCGDWIGSVKFAIANFKNDSFIQQFLSPKVMRDFQMFSVHDDGEKDYLEVTAIQDERGYREIRENLAMRYNLSSMMPEIQVTHVDLWDTRKLTLTHNIINDRTLDHETAMGVLSNIETLWGYDVELNSVDSKGNLIETLPEDYETGEELTLIPDGVIHLP